MVAKNNLVVNGWRWEGRKEEVYGAATGLIVAGGSRDLLGALQLALPETKRVESKLG